MQLKDTALVPVQLEWDGWRVAEVPLDSLHDIHWFQPPRAPRPMLHAYVPAVSLAGAANAGGDNSTSQRLLVCVLKRHTAATVYDLLTRQADRTGTGAPAQLAHI